MDLWLACVDQILTVRLFRSDRYSGRVLLPDRSTASKLWNQQRPKQQRILEHVRVAGIVTTAEPVESPGASGSLRTTVPRFARVVIGSRSCSGAAGACFRNRRLICRRCRPSGKDCAPGSPFARPCRMIARTAAASGAASTWPPWDDLDGLHSCWVSVQWQIGATMASGVVLFAASGAESGQRRSPWR